MKKLIPLFAFVLCVLTLSAQQAKTLKFKANGKFKIVQFTDIHYKKGNPESAVALKMMNEVLDTEKPDLVIFTGDIVYAVPAFDGLNEVFATVIDRKIPWAYIFGNHDDEQDITRKGLMDYAVQKPYCLSEYGDEYLKGIGNFVLELRDKDGKSNKALLYLMDSGSYAPIKEIKGYDWFDFGQIDWYKKQSAAYTLKNGGNPLPALAFFHIPLPEYMLMTADKNIPLIGEKHEKECSPNINTGMFAAMREAGDVMGTFVGHDHDNDYIGMYYDICLAYGRFSGGKTEYFNRGINGCRVIELEEGKREFSTYIRLLGGQIICRAHYPSSFPKPEEKK